MIPRLRPPFSLIDLTAAVLPGRGDAIAEFEARFAERFGFPHAVFFPYGRSALYALLCALRWADREIVCPSYTCSAVPHAITLAGNRVRFADSDPSHFNVTAEYLRPVLTPDTALVILTPLFGYPIDRVACHTAIAERSPDALVMYDVAQGFGAEDDEGLQFSNADLALFSFGIGKMVSTLYGGMLLIRRGDIHDVVRRHRDLHFGSATVRRPFELLAYGAGTWCAFRKPLFWVANFLEERTGLLDHLTKYYYAKDEPRLPSDVAVRPVNLQARLGLRQLGRYDGIVAARRRVCRRYEERLRCEGVRVFEHSHEPTYSLFPLAVSDADAARKHLACNGVQVGVLIDYNCADLPGYETHEGTCINARRWGRSMINLPNWPGLTQTEADRVIDVLLRWRDRSVLQEAEAADISVKRSS